MAHCITCKDYGFVALVLNPGQQAPHGYEYLQLGEDRVITCYPCPDCHNGIVVGRMAKIAAVPEPYKDASIENLKPMPQNEQVIAFLRTWLLHWTRRVPFKAHQLAVLYGNNGTGKTHILCLAINEAIKRGYSAAYVLMADLIDTWRREMNNSNYDPERMKVWNEVDLLGIDEVEKVSDTSFVREKIDLLLGHRYESKCLTILATNQVADELGGYITSRAGDNIFDMNGVDMRAFMRGDNPGIYRGGE